MTEPHRSVSEHRRRGAADGPIRVAIVTVSDTRSKDTDTSGRYLCQQLEQLGHNLVDYRVIRDEPSEVKSVLDQLEALDARIVIYSGGTGLSRRDNTYDALVAKLQKVLPGFGELFRQLSYEEIGAAAMLSRAVAGTYGDAFVFSLPGSSHAVRLAWTQLIAPELAHIAWEMQR